MNHPAKVSLVITDLDNTLWDWFEAWHSAFAPFLEELKRVTGIPESQLKAEIKAVHEAHGTSEYSHVLQELPCLVERFGSGFDPKEHLPSVIAAFRKGRASADPVYPGVLQTLSTIRKEGARIVAFTDSQLYYTAQRVRVFELDGILDAIYTPQDTLPPPDELAKMRSKPDGYYELKTTATIALDTRTRKPDVSLLMKILRDEDCPPENAIFVGDSLIKDIAMANEAGVASVYAEYGKVHKDPRYDLLRDVTHWPASHVSAEKHITAQDVRPRYTLHAFADLLSLFQFQPLRT